MKSRLRLSIVGLMLVVGIALFGFGTSTASGAQTNYAEQCTPGRALCLTVSQFENVTASQPGSDGTRYTWVQWSLRNNGGSTLTQLSVDVSLTGTASFVTPLPAGCTGSGTAITCRSGNLAGLGSSPVTRVYFKTADAPATSNDITITAFAKEGANDGHDCPAGGTDPNCDTNSRTITNSYEQLNDEAATWGLNGNRFNLPTNDGLSSFAFTAQGSAPFFVKFNKLTATDTASLCFSDVVCFDKPLSVDTSTVLSYGTSNPVLFFSHLVDAPVNASKLNAIHYYDPVALTAASNRLSPGTSPSFARMDGVQLTSAAFGLTPGKYFVVGYTAANNSFRLSATKGGTPLALTAGSANGNPIRIIGDDNDERSTSLCSKTLPPVGTVLPKLCAVKVGAKDLDAYLWDDGNGKINW